MQFIDVYAMVALASLMADRVRGGEPVEVLAPPADTSNYMSRMGFQAFLDEHGIPVDRRLTDVRHNDHPGFLVELTQFRDTHGSEQVANLVWTRLEGHISNEMMLGVHEATAELGANVHEHASSPVGGFIAAQTYRRHTSSESVVIAVGDAGVGLRATLVRRFGNLSDHQAVAKALERDVSGTDDPGRGQGLADLVEFVELFGGTVVIHSGSALRILERGGWRQTEAPHFSGTLIGAVIPCRPAGGS